MRRSITGTLVAFAVTIASGAFQPAAAREEAVEPIEEDGGEYAAPSCPPGQTLYRIYCLTHQRHEYVCM